MGITQPDNQTFQEELFQFDYCAFPQRAKTRMVKKMKPTSIKRKISGFIVISNFLSRELSSSFGFFGQSKLSAIGFQNVLKEKMSLVK